MSGLTDATYTELTKFYQSEGRIIDAPKSYVRTGETCPIWFEPCQVWEIRGAELTLSPVHKAGVGLVDKQRGMSLRFPRFLKMRGDKGVEDATTAAQIAELFRMQIRRVEVEGDGDGGGKGGGGGKKKKEAEEEEGVEEEEEGWEDIL
jgi:DNA ligase-1